MLTFDTYRAIYEDLKEMYEDLDGVVPLEYVDEVLQKHLDRAGRMRTVTNNIELLQEALSKFKEDSNEQKDLDLRSRDRLPDSDVRDNAPIGNTDSLA